MRHLIYPVLPKKQEQSFLNLFVLLKAHYCCLVCAIIPLNVITSQNFFPFCLQCLITNVVFPVAICLLTRVEVFFSVFRELKSNCLSHCIMFVFPALLLEKFCIPDTADIYNLGFDHFWDGGDVAGKCKYLGQH